MIASDISSNTPDALWSAQEIALATHGQTTGTWAASGVSIDSRSINSGDLFIAIKGPNFDGHTYVKAAIDAGAAGAIVSRPIPEIGDELRLVMVNDTFTALNDLGAAARERSQATIIAVTGSVGKTGVKEALNLVLSEQGLTGASEGSLNNHWGLPLSLSRLPRDARFGVLELGMNHAGELTELSKIARPHVAIITTVAAVHKEHFKSEEEIADAKAEIFEGLEPDGFAILNADNRHFARLVRRAESLGVTKVLSFGEKPEADIRLLAADCDADGSNVTVELEGDKLDFRIGAPGAHWVYNSLCILGAVYASGGDWPAAAQALAGLTPPKGRGRRYEVRLPQGSIIVIDESYNASPTSMRAALGVLAKMAPATGSGRKVVVLGDMLELGIESPELHAGLKTDILDAGVDLVFCAGPLMRHLYDSLPQALQAGYADATDDLKPLVLSALSADDIVMVKGSNGSKISAIVTAILNHADVSGEPQKHVMGGEV